jgi:hypothetical protein
MFGKMAVDVTADGLGTAFGVDEDFGLGGEGQNAADQQQSKQKPWCLHAGLLVC